MSGSAEGNSNCALSTARLQIGPRLFELTRGRFIGDSGKQITLLHFPADRAPSGDQWFAESDEAGVLRPDMIYKRRLDSHPPVNGGNGNSHLSPLYFERPAAPSRKPGRKRAPPARRRSRAFVWKRAAGSLLGTMHLCCRVVRELKVAAGRAIPFGARHFLLVGRLQDAAAGREQVGFAVRNSNCEASPCRQLCSMTATFFSATSTLLVSES